MKPFRIETITLDEDEEVAGITVVIDAPYLPALETHLYPDDGAAKVVRVERGGTELWVDLSVTEILDLFRAQGKLRDDDPLQIPGAYNSLSMVVYRLMEDSP